MKKCECGKKFQSENSLNKHKRLSCKLRSFDKPSIEHKKKLVKCGKHFIDVEDISCIKQVKNDLWIVKLKSEPNPEWPIWLNESEMGDLVQHLDVIEP